jgi:hypothetical protein
MTTELAPQMRASNAERERVVAILQQAGVDGRLTLDEVDERVGSAYAATYRNELPALTEDLPAEEPAAARRGPRPVLASRGIRIHAVIAIVLSVLLITRWAASGFGFFWPFFPMMWLWGTLALRVAFRRSGGWSRPTRWAAR